MRWRDILISASLLATPAVGAGPAHANWTPDGVWLSTTNINDLSGAIIDDGSGGLLIWRVTRGGTSGPFLVADRVTKLGSVFPDWDAFGPNCSPGASATGDGVGGLYEAWADDLHAVRLSRIAGGGGIDPLWPPGGVVVSATSTGSPTVADDGAHGAFVGHSCFSTFQRYVVKRLLPDGSFAPGWPADGRLLGTSTPFYESRSIPDGSGGAIFLWPSDYLRVQRITATSAIAPGWPSDGQVVTWDYTILSLSDFKLFDALPSGPASFIAAWYASAGGNRWITLQKFDADGNMDLAWPVTTGPPAGVTPTEMQVISDGAGGAWVSWKETTTPRGTHVRSDGVKDLERIPLLPPGSVSSGFQRVAAGPAGGLIVVWSEPGDLGWPGRLRATWLLADGNPDPTQPAEGRLVATGRAEALLARTDGSGGAHVVWRQDNNAVPRVNWLPYPELTVDVPLPGAERSPHFSVSPNPASIALTARFALPEARAARLELIDLAGRVLRARDVSGAGEHVERIDGLDDLPAGVYFARLSQGRDVRIARVARVR